MKGAAIIHENVLETLEEKRAIFEELDRKAPQDVSLGSTSSTVPASQFPEHLAGRGRRIIVHPCNPPDLVPLVEMAGSSVNNPRVHFPMGTAARSQFKDIWAARWK